MKKSHGFSVPIFIILILFCLIFSACENAEVNDNTPEPTINTSVSPTDKVDDTTDQPNNTDEPTATAGPTATAEPTPTNKPDDGNILSNIPEFTYSGTLAGTYDMSASGMYYEKNSTTKYDPLLNGEPVVDDLGGGMMKVYTKVNSATDVHKYREDLLLAGYTLYAENELNKNLFSTWLSEKYVVTLSYLAARREFNILIEPMRDLPGLASENVYENKNIVSKAILLPTSHTGRENGLCLIYQLCDGSFIIVDGGHGIGFYPEEKKGFEETYDDNAEEIYQVLYNLAPDKDNIVIAAWFFTHPHWDHMGAIGPFADLYGDIVKVEKFVLNHPNNKTIQEQWNQSQANILYVTRMQNAFSKFKDAKVIEAHAGQKFHLRNAVIDVLSTWELQTEYSVKFESITTMNSASLILDIKIEGTRNIMLGDSGESSTAYLNKLYGSWLKADMVTVAHHGYQGANSTLYKYIDPDIVLWPINREDITSLLNEARHSPLKEADKIWVTGKSVTIIPIPYTSDADVIVFEAPVLAGKTWEEVYPVAK